jgi:hypothetical protein
MFAFSKEVAAVMEKFANGIGATTEKLADTADKRLDSIQRFWEPREFLRH